MRKACKSLVGMDLYFLAAEGYMYTLLKENITICGDGQPFGLNIRVTNGPFYLGSDFVTL